MIDLVTVIFVISDIVLVTGIIILDLLKYHSHRMEKAKKIKKVYTCLWCDKPLNVDMQKDVYIIYNGFGYLLCSWKCAYQYIKKEIVVTT